MLTDFVRDVRSLIVDWSKKRKHPILLGVRVPAHPDAASGLGMDAVLWAREQLVDMVVPCPFFMSSDFDIPVELWRERLSDVRDRVTVAPVLTVCRGVQNEITVRFGFDCCVSGVCHAA